MSERILIIRLGALGDVVNVMPAVAGLRRAHPQAHLAWLVEEAPSSLVGLDRDVDEVIVFPRRSYSHALRRPWLWPWLVVALVRFTAGLRRRRFDRVLDFQGHLKSGLLAVSTLAPWRAGYCRGHGREGSHLFLNVRVTPPHGAVSRRDRALALARAMDPTLQPAAPDITASAEGEGPVQDFLRRLGPGPRVIIHPGSSRYGRFKRWPAPRFGQLARRLADACGAASIITHGPQESEALLEQVAEAAQRAAALAPRLSLPELIALLRASDLFVGADSGPLHVAGILGVPSVAIFGPKDPRVYAPPGARVVRREDLDCSPCTRRRCGDPKCLLGLTVDQVAEAALELLRSRPGRNPS